jgi:hypothetical protein
MAGEMSPKATEGAETKAASRDRPLCPLRGHLPRFREGEQV